MGADYCRDPGHILLTSPREQICHMMGMIWEWTIMACARKYTEPVSIVRTASKTMLIDPRGTAYRRRLGRSSPLRRQHLGTPSDLGPRLPCT